MNSVFIATLGGVAALVFWGISDWLVGKSSKKFTNADVNLALQSTGAIAMLFVLIASGESLPGLQSFLIIMATAALHTAAYLCFIKALSTGESGVVVPLANAYPMVTLLLTFLFLSVTFTGLQIFSMIVIVAGAILLGTDRTTWRRKHRKLNKVVIFALGAALFYGFGFFAVSAVVDTLAWQVVLGILSIWMGLFALLIFVFKQGRDTIKTLPRVLHNKFGLLSGVVLALGSAAFYISADATGNILIPAVIASASPLVTSILAAVYDKESLIFSKRVGAVFVVFGVVILNI